MHTITLQTYGINDDEVPHDHIGFIYLHLIHK